MWKLIVAGMFVSSTAFVVMLSGPTEAAAQEKKAPKFLYGHDLRVRPGGKPHFDKDTPWVGVEVFEDEVTKAIVGISESGALSVTPAGSAGMDKTCKWLTAHDLAVRRAGEPEFTDKTKKWGVELFRDHGSNRLLYACESGSIAFAKIPGSLVTDKGPRWHHGLEPKVRTPDQATFENAPKLGMEVFKDDNTGGLIYITEKGGIATGDAPASPPDSKKIAPPVAKYGLVLRVRGSNEPDFTDKTKKIGVEVFEDPNANNQLFYITETGYVATAPNPGKLIDAKGVKWASAMALKARKGGIKEFEAAKKYGIEVFIDNRTGNLIFISETGSIAVLPK